MVHLSGSGFTEFAGFSGFCTGGSGIKSRLLLRINLGL